MGLGAHGQPLTNISSAPMSEHSLHTRLPFELTRALSSLCSYAVQFYILAGGSRAGSGTLCGEGGKPEGRGAQPGGRGPELGEGNQRSGEQSWGWEQAGGRGKPGGGEPTL